MADTMTLVFGILAIVFSIVGGGFSILMISLSAVRSVKRESDESMQLFRKEVQERMDNARRETEARIDALRIELTARIEALRIETKEDRHTYVRQIDAVLNDIRSDVFDMSAKMAEGFGKMANLQSFQGGR